MFFGGDFPAGQGAAWDRLQKTKIKDVYKRQAPLPIFEGEEEGSSVGQSSYLVISSTSKHPDEAYKFIEFYCTSPEGTSIIAENSDVPSYTTDEAMEVYKTQVNVPGVEYRFSAKIKDEQKGCLLYTSRI